MKGMFGKKETKRADAFAGVNVEAPLWILLPKAFGLILFSDALLLVIFLLGAGELNAFFFGFVIFISVLQILVIIGLRFQAKPKFYVTKTLGEDFLDDFGAWWLVTCAFGALFGWICGQLAEAVPEFENVFLSLAVIFTIILPFLTMLPHLRYLEMKTAYIQIPLLFFVTILPILVGLNSLLKLWNLIFP